MTDTIAPSQTCRNCAAALTGPFCAECGQKAQAGPPTVREFLHDAVEEVFSVDGKFFRSVYLLFTRPGFLTRELFNGRRTRYVRPLRLYLICSVAMFGMMALTGERITLDRPEPPSTQYGSDNRPSQEIGRHPDGRTFATSIRRSTCVPSRNTVLTSNTQSPCMVKVKGTVY